MQLVTLRSLGLREKRKNHADNRLLNTINELKEFNKNAKTGDTLASTIICTNVT